VRRRPLDRRSAEVGARYGRGGGPEPCLPPRLPSARPVSVRVVAPTARRRGRRSPGPPEATRPSRFGDAGKKFPGTRGVASRNRLIRIHVAHGTIRSNFAPRWGPTSRRQAPPGENPDVLATLNFREFLSFLRGWVNKENCEWLSSRSGPLATTTDPTPNSRHPSQLGRAIHLRVRPLKLRT
jgi:hypothetical protein